jgi:hypothetical protein
MQILTSIYSAATIAQKRFLLIGGHALNAHGIMRATGYIDLMVEARDSAFWTGLLEKLGYETFHQSSAFMQSKSKDLTAWPIDHYGAVIRGLSATQKYPRARVASIQCS